MGAIYLRTGDISSCMLIHFLNDVLGMMHVSSSTGVMTGTYGLTSYLVYAVVWAVRICFGLRGIKTKLKNFGALSGLLLLTIND